MLKNDIGKDRVEGSILKALEVIARTVMEMQVGNICIELASLRDHRLRNVDAMDLAEMFGQRPAQPTKPTANVQNRVASGRTILPVRQKVTQLDFADREKVFS